MKLRKVGFKPKQSPSVPTKQKPNATSSAAAKSKPNLIAEPIPVAISKPTTNQLASSAPKSITLECVIPLEDFTTRPSGNRIQVNTPPSLGPFGDTPVIPKVEVSSSIPHTEVSLSSDFLSSEENPQQPKPSLAPSKKDVASFSKAPKITVEGDNLSVSDTDSDTERLLRLERFTEREMEQSSNLNKMVVSLPLDCAFSTKRSKRGITISSEEPKAKRKKTGEGNWKGVNYQTVNQVTEAVSLDDLYRFHQYDRRELFEEDGFLEIPGIVEDISSLSVMPKDAEYFEQLSVLFACQEVLKRKVAVSIFGFDDW
ncbi:uncharacterized protein [Euphorbia lathyris]|uniref:uncharacterized protein n=1 Tax=Euphorbia lathyris TaxID=212925 RepID=UPI003313C781